MSKQFCYFALILCLSVLVVVSCAGEATAPAPLAEEEEIPAVEKGVTVEVPTPAHVCGDFAVSKIVGTWKSDKVSKQTVFTFAPDCAVSINIDGTGEELGKYSLQGENKLSLALPNREGLVDVRFEGENILILEDTVAAVTLTLHKSSE